MLLIADNLNSQNPSIAAALERLDGQPIVAAVRHLEQAGAEALDLNPGYLSRRRHDRMAFLVETVQEATSLPLFLDHPDPRVLAAGLAVCQRPPIINGATLEPAKIAEILPLAAAWKAPLVLLLLDARGLNPAPLEAKAALALELREQAHRAGLATDRLWFDPILPNLSWPDAFSQLEAVVRLVRLLAGGELFGEPVRTLVGLSNLRSGLRRRYGGDYDAACLNLLAGAGLQAVLADVTQADVVRAWPLIRRFNDVAPLFP